MKQELPVTWFLLSGAVAQFPDLLALILRLDPEQREAIAEVALESSGQWPVAKCDSLTLERDAAIKERDEAVRVKELATRATHDMQCAKFEMEKERDAAIKRANETESKLAATDRLNSTLLVQAGRHVDDLASVAERQREACAQVCDFFGYPIVGGKVRSTRLVTAPAPEKPRNEAKGAERGAPPPSPCDWNCVKCGQPCSSQGHVICPVAIPMVPATESAVRTLDDETSKKEGAVLRMPEPSGFVLLPPELERAIRIIIRDELRQVALERAGSPSKEIR